jgi:type IX secretion system substrate protein
MNAMHKTGLLLALFILPRLMCAQDYQTVRSDRVVTFIEIGGGDIRFIRIDSMVSQPDSIFYPMHHIQWVDNYCYTPYGGSWVGKSIIIRQDGYNLFTNKFDDTIKINTRAKLNESWVCYNVNDTIVTAKVISHDTLHFLGLIDSVKEISFTATDTNMKPIPLNINQWTIKLSKNHGFVNTLGFYLFPEIPGGFSTFYSEYIDAYELKGLSNPKTGIQPLKWFDVFDFQPGDEIHTLYLAKYAKAYSGFIYETNIHKTIDIYLTRMDLPNRIEYTIDRKRSKIRRWDDSVSYSYSHDTIKKNIYPDTLFDHLSMEPIVDPFISAYKYEARIGFYIQGQYIIKKSEPNRYGLGYNPWDSCWTQPQIDPYGCIPFYDVYYQGLGGPYYSCSELYSATNRSYNIVYFKKGNITWGTPLVITGIEGHKKPLQAKVFPNPAKGQIWIETETTALPLIFELIDLHGRTLMIKEINSGYFSVDTGPYPSGIYLYQLQDKNGRVGHGKLVVE